MQTGSLRGSPPHICVLPAIPWTVTDYLLFSLLVGFFDYCVDRLCWL